MQSYRIFTISDFLTGNVSKRSSVKRSTQNLSPKLKVKKRNNGINKVDKQRNKLTAAIQHLSDKEVPAANHFIITMRYSKGGRAQRREQKQISLQDKQISFGEEIASHLFNCILGNK